MSDTDTPTLADLLAQYKATVEIEDAVKADKAEVRARIDRVLRDEYDSTHTLVTHRLPGVGTTYLSGGGPRASVSQPEAYAAWVAERMPEAVSFVVTFPRKVIDSDQFQRAWSTVQLLATDKASKVDPAALEILAGTGRMDAETGQLWSADGELVEGVRVAATAPHLVVKPAKDASPEVS